MATISLHGQFLQTTHVGFPIADLWGKGMGCYDFEFKVLLVFHICKSQGVCDML